jgi:hypothetical protein
MANALRGEAPLGDLTLAFNFGTFIELEQKTGMKMQGLMLAVQDGLGFGQLRDFLWAGLLKHHAMSEADVTALLDDVGFEAAATAVGKCITSFFGEQKAKAENPPKAK